MSEMPSPCKSRKRRNKYMNNKNEILGIIAGGGQFPLLVAGAAKKLGIHVVAVAHLGETDESLADIAQETEWIRLGQLGQLIKLLRKRGVSRAIMAGTIKKRRMFENIRPDIKGLSLISKLAVFHDDDILSAVSREFSKEGIEIVSSTEFLPDLIAPEGCLTKRRPTRDEREDIELGWKIAKEIGLLDIGQCVVVRQKTILAVEAIEGTDETILRGGRLGREKAVVVKVSKPKQDLRFDVPSVGPGTIETMSKVKASVLAVEAGKSLMFEREKMLSMADSQGISVISR